MKTKFNFNLVCMILVSLATFSSCEKNDSSDTTKPVINLIAPEEGAVLIIGDDHGIHFDLELSDNVMLQSYKVDIHPDFDGHVHTSMRQSSAPETVDFTFSKSWDVSDMKNADIHNHDIKIPANATPGNYHMMVYCTDAAGNEAHLARNIVLSAEGEE